MANKGLIIGLGVLTVGGIAIAALAMGGGGGGGSGAGANGVRIIGDCEDIQIVDPAAFQRALIPAVQRAIIESSITDARELVAVLFRDLVPSCTWPPPAGTAIAEKWGPLESGLAEQLQPLLDQLRGQEGVSAALSPDVFQHIAQTILGAVYGPQ